MVIVGLVLGGIFAAILAAVGLGDLALIGAVIGFIYGVFIGSSSGMSTRIGKGIWIHHRW
jgi:hypothetical protein